MFRHLVLANDGRQTYWFRGNLIKLVVEMILFYNNLYYFSIRQSGCALHDTSCKLLLARQVLRKLSMRFSLNTEL